MNLSLPLGSTSSGSGNNSNTNQFTSPGPVTTANSILGHGGNTGSMNGPMPPFLGMITGSPINSPIRQNSQSQQQAISRNNSDSNLNSTQVQGLGNGSPLNIAANSLVNGSSSMTSSTEQKQSYMSRDHRNGSIKSHSSTMVLDNSLQQVQHATRDIIQSVLQIDRDGHSTLNTSNRATNFDLLNQKQQQQYPNQAQHTGNIDNSTHQDFQNSNNNISSSNNIIMTNQQSQSLNQRQQQLNAFSLSKDDLKNQQSQNQIQRQHNPQQDDIQNTLSSVHSTETSKNNFEVPPNGLTGLLGPPQNQQSTSSRGPSRQRRNSHIVTNMSLSSSKQSQQQQFQQYQQGSQSNSQTQNHQNNGGGTSIFLTPMKRSYSYSEATGNLTANLSNLNSQYNQNQQQQYDSDSKTKQLSNYNIINSNMDHFNSTSSLTGLRSLGPSSLKNNNNYSNRKNSYNNLNQYGNFGLQQQVQPQTQQQSQAQQLTGLQQQQNTQNFSQNNLNLNQNQSQNQNQNGPNANGPNLNYNNNRTSSSMTPISNLSRLSSVDRGSSINSNFTGTTHGNSPTPVKQQQTSEPNISSQQQPPGPQLQQQTSNNSSNQNLNQIQQSNTNSTTSTQNNQSQTVTQNLIQERKNKEFNSDALSFLKVQNASQTRALNDSKGYPIGLPGPPSGWDPIMKQSQQKNSSQTLRSGQYEVSQLNQYQVSTSRNSISQSRPIKTEIRTEDSRKNSYKFSNLNHNPSSNSQRIQQYQQAVNQISLNAQFQQNTTNIGKLVGSYSDLDSIDNDSQSQFTNTQSQSVYSSTITQSHDRNSNQSQSAKDSSQSARDSDGPGRLAEIGQTQGRKRLYSHSAKDNDSDLGQIGGHGPINTTVVPSNINAIMTESQTDHSTQKSNSKQSSNQSQNQMLPSQVQQNKFFPELANLNLSKGPNHHQGIVLNSFTGGALRSANSSGHHHGHVHQHHMSTRFRGQAQGQNGGMVGHGHGTGQQLVLGLQSSQQGQNSLNQQQIQQQNSNQNDNQNILSSEQSNSNQINQNNLSLNSSLTQGQNQLLNNIIKQRINSSNTGQAKRDSISNRPDTTSSSNGSSNTTKQQLNSTMTYDSKSLLRAGAGSIFNNKSSKAQTKIKDQLAKALPDNQTSQETSSRRSSLPNDLQIYHSSFKGQPQASQKNSNSKTTTNFTSSSFSANSTTTGGGATSTEESETTVTVMEDNSSSTTVTTYSRSPSKEELKEIKNLSKDDHKQRAKSILLGMDFGSKKEMRLAWAIRTSHVEAVSNACHIGIQFLSSIGIS